MAVEGRGWPLMAVPSAADGDALIATGAAAIIRLPPEAVRSSHRRLPLPPLSQNQWTFIHCMHGLAHAVTRYVQVLRRGSSTICHDLP